MGMTLLGGSGDLDALIRTYAFRLLLESGRPVDANELAGFTGLDQDQIERAVDRLDQGGAFGATGPDCSWVLAD